MFKYTKLLYFCNTSNMLCILKKYFTEFHKLFVISIISYVFNNTLILLYFKLKKYICILM